MNLAAETAIDSLPATVPSVPRGQGLRDTRRMIANPLGVLLEHSRAMGENYYYHFGGIKRVLVSSHPAVLRHVLKDNWENYRKSDIQIKRMGEFLGSGLLTSHGETWHRQRRLIQQGFRPSALAALSPIMQASLADSLQRFDASARRGPIKLSSALMAITFEMVARSLFSTRMTDGEIQQISDAIAKIQSFMVKKIVQPYLTPWFVVSGQARRHQAMRDAGDAILLRHIRERRQQRRDPPDLLQLLLDAGAGDDTAMSDAQVLSESMQLLVAGHETSSNALSWTLYLLSRHPEYFERSREEFGRTLGDRPLDYTDLPSLTLNAWILEESLRLYPPFWMVDRVSVDHDRVGNLEIPAGTTIVAFFYGVHHSPRRWQDPERFYPERFMGDDRTNREFTYLPFGGGPRACVGANYAMLQMLMILSVLVRRYRFTPLHDGPVDMRPMFILRPDGGLPVRVSR